MNEITNTYFLLNLKDLCVKLKKDILSDYQFSFSDGEYMIYTKNYLQDIYDCNIRLHRDILMKATGYGIISFNNQEKGKEFIDSFKEFMSPYDMN